LSFFLPPLITSTNSFKFTITSYSYFINYFFSNPSVFFCTILFIFKLSLTKSMTIFFFEDNHNKFSSGLIKMSVWPHSSINSDNTNIKECIQHLFSPRCFIRAFSTFHWFFFSSLIYQPQKDTWAFKLCNNY